MKKGFTIVELLMFMGIFSILIVLLTEILTSVLSLKLETEAVSSVEEDGRYILARLMYDINRAQVITSPAASGGTGNALSLTIGGTAYSYNISSGNLVLNDGSPDNLNSFNTAVSAFNITHLGPGIVDQYYEDTVKINFTVTSRVIKKSGTETKNYQTTVGLR